MKFQDHSIVHGLLLKEKTLDVQVQEDQLVLHDLESICIYQYTVCNVLYKHTVDLLFHNIRYHFVEWQYLNRVV
jgi:hypothetical protein